MIYHKLIKAGRPNSQLQRNQAYRSETITVNEHIYIYIVQMYIQSIYDVCVLCVKHISIDLLRNQLAERLKQKKECDRLGDTRDADENSTFSLNYLINTGCDVGSDAGRGRDDCVPLCGGAYQQQREQATRCTVCEFITHTHTQRERETKAKTQEISGQREGGRERERVRWEQTLPCSADCDCICYPKPCLKTSCQLLPAVWPYLYLYLYLQLYLYLYLQLYRQLYLQLCCHPIYRSIYRLINFNFHATPLSPCPDPHRLVTLTQIPK